MVRHASTESISGDVEGASPKMRANQRSDGMQVCFMVVGGLGTVAVICAVSVPRLGAQKTGRRLCQKHGWERLP